MKNFNSSTKILRKKTKKIIQDDDYDDNNFGIIKINVDLEIKKYYPKDSNQSLLLSNMVVLHMVVWHLVLID